MHGVRVSPRRAKGFTLIELLTALIVIALLTAIALPSFNEYVRKSRRSEAYAALASVQQAQERWRANNSAYAASSALTASSPGLGLASTTPGGYYGIAIDAADAVSYSVTATATSGTSQAQDGNCVRLRVRANGGNLVYGSATAGGSFNESTGNPCWSR